ncbi:hypothetical protein ABOM_007589 [Aspergillus bombycis]|uniref:Heterokaryon incompatibility domain-containing protein n=1 Tax=Aspergillus bombycis TaxID=109264 RepID=A0A1F7ZWH3_9EURO|nr:hypothetical protein ABOM_007589 [Aspergillus bombycis]OGM43806.1 hypothetical protein ABOM_007589 [Aspergillus bombycis]
MDLDTVDLKHRCAEFDIDGDCCSSCKSALSVDGFRHMLEQSQGYLHSDLATLKEKDSCPLCRVILGCFNGSRLYKRSFREESVNVILRIQARPKCNGLSQGSAGESPMHVLSISLHSIEFADVVSDINYELDIFAYEDDPAASWVLSRPPELDVTSPRTIAKAKAMISECQLHHEAASPNVNLHSLDGASGYSQYLTLSYCWGRNQPLVTLKRNFNDLKNGIGVTFLPQTMQDAVQTTRDLGYQYLWVDALCIIQDDEEDIKREIGAMADIYRNSTATILAATSRSVGEGYLKSSRKHRPFITLSVQLPNGKTGEVQIGHPCQFAHFGWHLDPLAQRGWALQESLLARRILYYGPYEVLFHCQTLGYRRLLPSYIIYPENEQPSSRSLFHSQDRTASWSELVRQYTFRNLTYSEDRPRAISGIVATLEELWNDKCVFGAWASRFVEHMTWFNVAGFRPSLRKSNRAPSWSWLSIDGHVAAGAKLTLICRVTPEHKWPSLEPNLFDIYWDVDNTNDSRGMPYFYLYLGVEARLSPEKWYHAFALAVVQVEAHVFRRIGLIIVQSGDMKVVRHLEETLHAPQPITLV